MNKKFIRNIIITALSIGLIILLFNLAPDFVDKDKDIANKTKLIINNKNVTRGLKKDAFIENGVVYLSEKDIKNFFDKYLYLDEKENLLISTFNANIGTIAIDSNILNVNDEEIEIKGKLIKKDDIIFLPFSEMEKVYDIELEYIEKTNTVVVVSTYRELIEGTSKKEVSVKTKMKSFSRTLDKVKENETFAIISKEKNWARIRTKNGIIGYIHINDILSENVIREEKIKVPQVEGKINLVWDYYSEYVSVPDRTGTKIDGLNVISPAFFVLEKLGKGNLIDKAKTGGVEYINWAHSNNYKVWAMVANDSMIETTGEIMKDYKLRKKLIDNIVKMCEKYKIDGINIDFENMYKADVDLFSRFLIELYPKMYARDIVLSVDVTAPDGGDNWSLCYDRNVIADNCDYIVFMAYDQYASFSTKAGTTAGYDWMKVSLNKFLKTEEIKPEKIVLALPFYTRIWKENNEGKLESSNIVNVKDVDTVLEKNNITQKQWLESVRQNYVEYKKDDKIYKMWIEDKTSLAEKISLAVDNKLAGIAFWAKDRENEEIWQTIKESLNK